MTRMKRILSTLLSIALILSLCSGCGMFTNYKAIAEQALEDKYGEEFVCYSTWDEGSFYYAKLSPAYDEGMKFYAGIDLKDKEAYYDTYTEAIVEKQIADIVYELMADVWNDFCVHVTIDGQEVDFSNNDEITIQSYYNKIDYSKGYGMHIYVSVNNDAITNNAYVEEYDTLLNLSNAIHVDDIFFHLIFVDNNAYMEYKDWFYSTYSVPLGNFKERDDFKKRIVMNINYETEEYSLSLDDYISQRSEAGGNI